MTIIVGIICNDGVIVASDSQAGMFRGVHVKRLDYTKIYDFSFGGFDVVVTGSGEAPFITRAKEIIEEKLEEAKIHSLREIADIAEDTMTEINRRYVVERYREMIGAKTGRAPTTQDDMMMGPSPNFDLVIAARVNKEFAVYGVYPDGVASREESYASTGSGSAFAEYLLARLYQSDFSLEEALRSAIYVVQEVKKADVHCGGPTQAVVLTKSGIERKDEAEIRSIVLQLEGADESLKRSWRIISAGPKELEKLLAEAKTKPKDGS